MLFLLAFILENKKPTIIRLGLLLWVNITCLYSYQIWIVFNSFHLENYRDRCSSVLVSKIFQLRQEKCRLEQTLEQEQECLVNKLMRKIEKLEAETLAKQTNLERLRREKVTW